MGFPGDLQGVLRHLKSRMAVYFEKTMAATNVPIKYGHLPADCQLALAAYFIREHSDKLRKTVALLSANPGDRCQARLFVSFRRNGRSSVVFGAGWKSFATLTGLKQGDRLIFHLSAMSEFVVFIFHNSGHPIAGLLVDPSVVATRPLKLAAASRSALPSDAKPAPVKLKSKLRSRRPNFVLLLVAKISQRLVAVSYSSGNLELTRFIPVHPLHMNPMLLIRTPAPNLGTYRKTSDQYELFGTLYSHNSGMGAEESHGYYPEPGATSFLKTLSDNNFHNSKGHPTGASMEIPVPFLREHYHQLQSRREVKLQSILERSQTLVVGLAEYGTRQPWRRRVYLKDCWHDFLHDNSLRVGDELVFTLVDVANSSLAVRRELQ